MNKCVLYYWCLGNILIGFCQLSLAVIWFYWFQVSCVLNIFYWFTLGLLVMVSLKWNICLIYFESVLDQSVDVPLRLFRLTVSTLMYVTQKSIFRFLNNKEYSQQIYSIFVVKLFVQKIQSKVHIHFSWW